MPESGIWYDDTGKGAVELKACGAKLCGYIIWLKNTTNDQGQPLVDRHNPDPGKQSRPICGLNILGNLQKMPEGGWDTGWVYDPKTGKSFDAALQLENKDQLTLIGYKGVKFLSKSFTWTRAPGDLPRCDAATEAKAAPPVAKPIAQKPVATVPVEKAAKAADPKVAPKTLKAATTTVPSARAKPAVQKTAAPQPAATQKSATAEKPAAAKPATTKAAVTTSTSDAAKKPAATAAKPTTTAPKTTTTAKKTGAKPTKEAEAEVLPWATATPTAKAAAKTTPPAAQ